MSIPVNICEYNEYIQTAQDYEKRQEYEKAGKNYEIYAQILKNQGIDNSLYIEMGVKCYIKSYLYKAGEYLSKEIYSSNKEQSIVRIYFDLIINSYQNQHFEICQSYCEYIIFNIDKIQDLELDIVAHNTYAMIFFTHQDYITAEIYFEKCLNLLHDANLHYILKDSKFRLIYQNIAFFFYSIGRFEKSKKIYFELYNISLEILGINSYDTKIYADICNKLDKERDIVKKNYEHTIDTQKNNIDYLIHMLRVAREDEDSINIMIINTNIGIFYENIENYDYALSYLIQALEISDSINDDIYNAINYSYIGNIYFNFLLSNILALNFYQKALQIYNSLYGEYNVHSILILKNIALVHKKQKKYSLCEEIYTNLLMNEIKKYNEHSTELIDIYKEYKQYYDDINETQKSEILIQEIQKIQNLQLSEEYISIYKEFIGEKDYKKAQEYLEKAILFRENSVNEDIRISSLYLDLGHLCALQKNDEVAEFSYKKAINIAEKLIGTFSLDICKYYDSIADFYIYTQKPEISSFIYKKIFEIYKFFLGLEHNDTQRAMQKIDINIPKKNTIKISENITLH